MWRIYDRFRSLDVNNSCIWWSLNLSQSVPRVFGSRRMGCCLRSAVNWLSEFLALWWRCHLFLFRWFLLWRHLLRLLDDSWVSIVGNFFGFFAVRKLPLRWRFALNGSCRARIFDTLKQLSLECCVLLLNTKLDTFFGFFSRIFMNFFFNFLLPLL